MSRPVDQRRRDLALGSAVLAFTALHILATASAFAALVFLTRGGGEGYPASPAIDAAAGVLQSTAFPLAWAFASVSLPGVLMLLLRLLNSLLVGALTAWMWVKTTQRP